MKKYLSKKKGNYLQLSRNKVIFVIFILVVIIGFFIPQAFNYVGKAALMPLHVVRVAIADTPISAFGWNQSEELEERVQELQQELVNKEGSAAKIARLEADNELLRDLLSDEQPEHLGARVLARPPYIPYDLLQIDKGSEDGVVLHAPVFIGQDIIVGFVSHVTPTYSHVTLASTPGQSATGYLLNTNIYTTIEGVGDGVLRVRIPQGIEVDEGEVVIVPALYTGAFGTISHIETTPTQPEKYGYISLPIPIQELRYVAVGRQSMKPLQFNDIAEEIERTSDLLMVGDTPLHTETDVATSTATTTEEEGDI